MNPRKRRLTAVIALLCIIIIGYCMVEGFTAGWASYLYSKARVLLAEGHMSEGVDTLRRARRWDPQHAGATLLLARAAEGSGDPSQAHQLLEDFYEGGGRTVEALDAYARILEWSDVTARSNIEGVAGGIYEEMCRLFPEAVAGPLGLARLKGGRAALDELLRLSRSPARTDSVRGFALLHLGDDFGVAGYGTPAAAQSLLAARDAGANSISIRVPGRQSTVNSTRINAGGEGAGGETDLALRRMIRDARLLGFRVLLKPHIMLGRITAEEWRGTIHFEDPKMTETWWASYRKFILRYAKMAREEAVDAFCVGVELRQMVRAHPDRWNRLIADVRKIYDGQLTYAANWFYEYEEVPFWPLLDFIGLQFFFPLTEKDDPSVQDLIESLQPVMTNLQDLANGYDRPVVLTEVGYKSTPGSTREPWIWPELEDPPDMEIQCRAYEAIFTVFEGVPWFGGMYWWNWLTTPEPDEKFLRDFTPQGKPALELLIERWSSS